MAGSWNSPFRKSRTCQFYKANISIVDDVIMQGIDPVTPEYLDDLMQDCSDSIANALELLQSCTKPSICYLYGSVKFNSILQNNGHFADIFKSIFLIKSAFFGQKFRRSLFLRVQLTSVD